MARLHEIKKMMMDYDVSVLDINWQLLKTGELKKLLKWEMNQHPKLGMSCCAARSVRTSGWLD